MRFEGCSRWIGYHRPRPKGRREKHFVSTIGTDGSTTTRRFRRSSQVIEDFHRDSGQRARWAVVLDPGDGAWSLRDAFAGLGHEAVVVDPRAPVIVDAMRRLHVRPSEAMAWLARHEPDTLPEMDVKSPFAGFVDGQVAALESSIRERLRFEGVALGIGDWRTLGSRWPAHPMPEALRTELQPAIDQLVELGRLGDILIARLHGDPA
jgi:hypothetical protein